MVEARGLACSGHPSGPLPWPSRPSKNLGPVPGLGHPCGPSRSRSQKPGAIAFCRRRPGTSLGPALRADEAAQRSQWEEALRPAWIPAPHPFPARRPPAAVALAGCGRGGAGGRHDPAAQLHAQLAALPTLEGQGRGGAVGTGLAARGQRRHPLGVPADPRQRPETGVCLGGGWHHCVWPQPASPGLGSFP